MIKLDTEKDFGDIVAEQLLKEHGPLLSGEKLWKTVGYSSAEAFRKAKAQNRLEVTVFPLPNRRGSYAFTRHVADWLKQLAKEAKMK